MRRWIARKYGVRIMRWLYGRTTPSYEIAEAELTLRPAQEYTSKKVSQ